MEQDTKPDTTEPSNQAASQQSPEGPERITYEQLVEMMFKHFEERDNLKVKIYELDSNDVSGQDRLAMEMRAFDQTLASKLAGIEPHRFPIVDAFMAMTLAVEATMLLAFHGLRQSTTYIFTGAQMAEASVRAMLEDQAGKKFVNTKLDLLRNAAEGKIAARQQRAEEQGRIILATK